MTDNLTLYKCGGCHRYFASEHEVREHHELYARLNAHDPAVGTHAPWSVETISEGETLSTAAGPLTVYHPVGGDGEQHLPPRRRSPPALD